MKIGSTFFFHSIWKVCGRRGNTIFLLVGNVQSKWNHCYCALIMITHHHISKIRFIYTQIICCKFFVIIWESQNGHFTSTTPSPQQLHVTMLSVLGSGKSTDSLPSKMEDRKCCHGLQDFIYWGVQGGSFPPKPSIFPPKVIHEKYLVIHEKYLVTSSHSCYIISFRVFFSFQY